MAGIDKLIVLTGGAGFIGSCLLAHLNEVGIDNVVVVDHLGTDGKWKNLVGKRFVDCLAIDQLMPWLAGRDSEIDAFIHLGACSATTERDASYLLENNYRYSVQLCEYAMRHGHRFIYASSAATYGDGSLGFVDDHDRIEELRPLNMYGYSKQMFDLWAKRHGLLDQIVALKYFNIFGPNEYHKGSMSSAILKLVPQLQQEGVVRLFASDHPEYGDGEQRRDFLFVKDAVRTTASFLTNQLGGIFNVGSGVATTWNQLATAVARSLSMEPNIEYIEMPKELVGSYQYDSCADLSKVRSHTELPQESTPFDDAVAEYVQEYILQRRCW